jgi:hypothetical protein
MSFLSKHQGKITIGVILIFLGLLFMELHNYEAIDSSADLKCLNNSDVLLLSTGKNVIMVVKSGENYSYILRGHSLYKKGSLCKTP